MNEDKNRGKKNATLKSRGSAAKSTGRAVSRDTGRLDTDQLKSRKKRTWREALVMYDENGNIVVRDRGLARKLGRVSRLDQTISVGWTSRASNAPIGGTTLKPVKGIAPPPNLMCQCGGEQSEMLPPGSTYVEQASDPV